MPGQRLGRGHRRRVRSERLAHRGEFGDVSEGRCSAVRVEVIDRPTDAVRRHAHAARRAPDVRRHHVGSVRRCTVADEFGPDPRTPPLRMLVVLAYQHAAAAREHDVLRAAADRVRCGTNAVRGRGTGGRDRIAEAEDAERRHQRRRHRRAHRARHHARPHLANPLLPQAIGHLDLPPRRGAARRRDESPTRVADVSEREAGIGDRRAHCHVRVCRRTAHEAAELAVDRRIDIDVGHAGNLAAQSQRGEVRQRAAAAAAIAQRTHDRVECVPRQDTMPMPGDDDPAHSSGLE